ncbi:unnamed protein product [Alopecurus aequalis]
MSWAWGSFLSRSLPLLRSSRQSARRHGSQLTTVFGRNNLMGPRGYASNSGGDLHTKVNRHDATMKRHLYVVLDNYKDGFGVHKLDLGDNDHDDLDGSATRRLTEPPFLRVVRTTLGERVQFTAVGSSIVATGNTIISPELAGRWIPDIGGVLIYDTKTAALTVAPHLPTGLVGGYKAAMAVGNILYMLGTEPPSPRWDGDDDDMPVFDSNRGGGSLHSLTTDPLNPVDSKEDKYWGWQLLSDSSPWLWSHFEGPPMVPFLAEYITALGATYTFSTASREWRRRGECNMPVVGHIHCDYELDAWVGLHAVIDGNMHGPPMTDGRLCVGNHTSTLSEWKVGKEKLFRLDEDDAAGWRHVDAKLVPIASDEGGSKYCLMERLRPEAEEKVEAEKMKEMGEKKCWDDGGKSLLRLTSFRVERGRNGEPMATDRLPVRSYEVSWHNRHFDAQAFWI